MSEPRTAVLTARGVAGLPEVDPGSDPADLIAGATDLESGDVVVVTSKIVSKAEGRVVRAAREGAVASETARVVARRGWTTIARTRHGLTLAAAGVDASNISSGSAVLLPVDPDASARRIRARLRALTGHNLAVVVSDTAGRPWREGQTDIAIGVAGLAPLASLAGSVDRHGNTLEVTAPAVADEVAGLADLVKGKLAGVPVAVVDGLADMVLPAEDDGPGAAALIRPDAGDMFGLGSREAVLAAVAREDPAALAALRREDVTAADLVSLAGPTGSDGATVHLDVQQVDEATVRVGGQDDLPTAAALERLLVAATTTWWVLVSDERNTGRCQVVIRNQRPGP